MAVLIDPFVDGCYHCRLAGGNGERDRCKQVYQQRVDWSHSITYGAGDRGYVVLAGVIVDRDTFFDRLCDRCERLGEGSANPE